METSAKMELQITNNYESYLKVHMELLEWVF